MFYSLSQHSNVFNRPEKSSLVLAVPLCARTVIFFCDDQTFYHYSLLENKILYQSKLPGRVINAVSLSGHQILCTILQSRALMLLNIQERSFDHICKLPQTKIHNENREKDIFTQTKLHIFESSGSFYIEQPHRQQSKTKIYFHRKVYEAPVKPKPEDFLAKQLNTRKHVVSKLDSSSKLVLFKQEIDVNNTFKFITVDCTTKEFLETQHTCVNEVFTRAAIVREVRDITRETDATARILIFVNSSQPEILVYSGGNVTEFGYKPNKIFLATVLVNVQLGYGMFMFMPDREEHNPKFENVIELVDIVGGKVLERRKLNVKEVVKSWEDDYLLLYKQEIQPTTFSLFLTENIISKKAFYMKFIQEKGYSDFPVSFLAEVIGMLQ